ncbi:MAG: tetratricopeptide repeat protein [Deltaproteobacteria bacterium]|nr:tetratricopeptide repeat protein [Deltaproteobacteria bacterium]
MRCFDKLLPTLRGELAELEAELAMKRTDVVLAESEQLDARAASLDYVPLRAEVTYMRGRALLRSDPKQGFELLEQTVDLAEGARHDRLVADAWRTMAMTAATELPDLERGRRWLRRADATATRLGDEPLTAGRLDYIRGNLFLLANDSKAAAEHFESALAVLERNGDTLYVAHTTSSLGIAMLGLGKDQRALELFERALELSREVYGARHPEVAAAAYDLGQVALDSDHMQLGRRMLEQAVAVWTEAPTTNPLDAGRAQLVLAQFALMEGRNQAALDLANAAALAFEHTPVASPAEHAEAARLVGASHYFMAEFEPAIVAYRRAVAGYTEAHGADDLYTAYFRVALGWALLAVGDVDDAEHEFESSLAIITAKATPADAIDARFGLVGVDLARGNHTSARARMAEIDPEQLADLELLEYELFNGLLLRRLDRDDPEAGAALARARTQAGQAINGEATLTVLLDSIGANPDERRLLTE